MAAKKDPDMREIWKGMVRKEQPELYKAINDTAYGGL